MTNTENTNPLMQTNHRDHDRRRMLLRAAATMAMGFLREGKTADAQSVLADALAAEDAHDEASLEEEDLSIAEMQDRLDRIQGEACDRMDDVIAKACAAAERRLEIAEASAYDRQQERLSQR